MKTRGRPVPDSPRWASPPACSSPAAVRPTSPPPRGGRRRRQRRRRPDGTISGAGASTQQAAMQAWIAGFTGANPDATVNYDPAGSGAGRTQFIAGGVAFAGQRRLPQAGDELTKAQARCKGDVVEVPAYVSPIAVVYNLPGVTDLQLAPATVARSSSARSPQWNDPEIAADNPGKTLPDQAITPVHRSDDSGTTQNFTDYLNKAAPGRLDRQGRSDTWPVAGRRGRPGHLRRHRRGAGRQRHDRLRRREPGRQPRQGDDQGRRRLRRPDARRPPRRCWPSPSASRVAATSSFAFDLDRTTTAAGTYPIVLVSYQIACSKYADAAQADLVKGFLDLHDQRRRPAGRGAGRRLRAAERRAAHADHPGRHRHHGRRLTQ